MDKTLTHGSVILRIALETNSLVKMKGVVLVKVVMANDAQGGIRCSDSRHLRLSICDVTLLVFVSPQILFAHLQIISTHQQLTQSVNFRFHIQASQLRGSIGKMTGRGDGRLFHPYVSVDTYQLQQSV